jgi:hypothetical protein
MKEGNECANAEKAINWGGWERAMPKLKHFAFNSEKEEISEKYEEREIWTMENGGMGEINWAAPKN